MKWKGNKHRIVKLANDLVPLLRNQIIQANDFLQFDIKKLTVRYPQLKDITHNDI